MLTPGLCPGKSETSPQGGRTATHHLLCAEKILPNRLFGSGPWGGGGELQISKATNFTQLDGSRKLQKILLSDTLRVAPTAANSCHWLEARAISYQGLSWI